MSLFSDIPAISRLPTQQTSACPRPSPLFRLAKHRASATLRPSHFLRGPRESIRRCRAT